MTRPDPSSTAPDPHPDDAEPRQRRAVDEASHTATDHEAEPEPQPEPWTPERVLEWNAYYDLYVLGAAILLVFVTSAMRMSHAPLWSNLRMGREIIAKGTPLLTDAFSYTEEGRRWVNVPWLFQAASAGLYDLAYGMVPESLDDPTAHRASAEQIGIGALVALTALIRAATAYLLIRIRHKGPGLWWAALCTALAFGAVFGPAGLTYGGIAQPAIVDPSTWGVFFLAVELLLLYRTFDGARRGALYALLPLFLIWANVDGSFLLGLLILAAAILGRLLDARQARVLPAATGDPEDEAPRVPVSVGTTASVLLACALAALLNPSHVMIYPTALEPVTSFFTAGDTPPTLNQLSYFGKTIREPQYGGVWQRLVLFYVLCVGFGLGSFVVNRARFSWARFLPFAVVAVVWAIYMRYAAEFAAVLAAVATLNGQEWFHRKYGVRGRMGDGWTFWSTGGRLATLAALFACVAFAITGYGKVPGEARFGFGFDPNDFAFSAADFLATRDDLKGNVFNWTPSQGDALVWRAGPTRKTFVDDRSHLFTSAVAKQHRKILNALRDDDPAVWKPIFDEYKISAVMVDSETAVNTQRRLSQSANWIPFYDDGKVTMFGRSDAAEPDVVTFKSNRLDPELLAFKTPSPVPSPDRPPTPVEFIDHIVRSRALTPPRSQNNAARRWLSGGTNPDGSPAPPDVARCLLAIRAARTALAQNPDDYTAYRILAISYRALAQQEAAILSGIAPTFENRERIAAIKPGGSLMNERLRQMVTALNYAVQTTPPPRNADDRRELLSLKFELFEMYAQLGYADLARDQLRSILDSAQAGDIPADARSAYSNQLAQLDDQVNRIEQEASNMQIERQAGPIELGQFALGQGAAGLAIVQFEDANRSNLSPTVVKPLLVDLYCGTGQPERSLEVIQPSGGVDPNLGEPAVASFRQGLIYKLIGNYSYAAMLWQSQSLPRIAFDRTNQAIGIANRMLRGELILASNESSAIPEMISRQSNWEFDVAQCLLEWGEPERAAEHYAKALELVPNSALRPLIAYYLEKIGKPVPPSSGEAASPASTSEAPKPETSAPAATGPEEPKVEEKKPAGPKVEEKKLEPKA